MYNAPLPELNRSPAAQIVAKLASDSGLFLTHFEHRHHLAIPSMWLPENRPDLDGDVTWVGGTLKEHKYLHFRYDQPLGSFHPGHRAKWTTHELCHGLVGFSWRPDMTPFSHTLTARLSELLPVALWYFFDEVQLRRCPLHYLQGALFQDHCVYCEQLATQGPRLPELEDEEMIKAGLRFVKDELAMIAKSKRFGRPLPNRFATLDLNSDAMAYVAQNIKRMEDPVFRKFIELFHGHHTGMWADLDELEGRVWGLTEALSGGLPANPLPAGKEHWIAQDLGWRLLSVSAQCEDKEAIERLDSLAEGLSKRPSELQTVFDGYQELFDAFFLPEPESMFAVGYPLIEPATGTLWGSDLTQLYRGVDSACPSLSKALGAEGLSEQISAFAVWDLERPQRIGVGKRFAQFLSETARGPLSDLASFEATLQHSESPDPWAASLGWSSAEGKLVRRSQGVEVLYLNVDVEALIDAIDREDEEIDVPERVHWILIVHQAGGVRRITEISERAASVLGLLVDGPVERSLLDLDEEDWETLVDAGAITPCNWHIYVPEELKPSEMLAHDGLLPDAFALTSSRGMWSQAKPIRSAQNEVDEEAIEPAPFFEVESERGYTDPPRTLSPEHEEETSNHLEADALHSLNKLSSIIDDVREGRTLSSHSALRRGKSERTTRAWGESAFRSAPQISSIEALREMGYREDRPPENPFEEKLRQALATQKQQELELERDDPSHQAEGLEDLFTFDLEDSIDDLSESELDEQLRSILGEKETSDSSQVANPQTESIEECDEGDSGDAVGFGARWGDWDDER